MRVCILTTQLDSFKGGNHLPLFGALPDVECVILTARAKLEGTVPANVKIVTLDVTLGSYYFGHADSAFAEAVFLRYPTTDEFWRQFDVVHLNQTFSPDLLRLQTIDKPLLYTVHHPVTADREVAMQESGLLGKMMWHARYARLRRWQGKICREAPHILTVSQTVKRRLMTEYGCDERVVSIIPNGVDGDEFFPSDEPPVADIIAVGSFIHPRKGFRYLLDAYRAFSAEGKRIADVGRRSGNQAALLRRIPGVTVHGPVPHAELVTLMRRSSVLISTSLYEGFGISLIEALACGHPAVAFASGAVPEVLGTIDSHLLISPRDTAMLTERVLSLLAMPVQERVKYGKALRKTVLERYSMKRAADALQALYTSL